jgi:hypothetical protein
MPSWKGLLGTNTLAYWTLCYSENEVLLFQNLLMVRLVSLRTEAEQENVPSVGVLFFLFFNDKVGK